ncbi:MAG: DUF2953 domain-containing protein [Clostridia bacterium]|nr:DUF2953 domain-containing protein [Clostridia bacterium]
MFFKALFIFIALLLILVFILTRLKLSLMTLIRFNDEGFKMEVRVMFYKLLTLYQWELEEGGLSFLLKKKKDVPDENKTKKGRLSSILRMQFSKDTLKYLRKDLQVFNLSVKGNISTKDAARTALLYGLTWQLLGMVIPFVPQKHLKLEFYPDFHKEKSDLLATCILRVQIIHIIDLILQHRHKNAKKGRSENYGTASN